MDVREYLRAVFGVERVVVWIIAVLLVVFAFAVVTGSVASFLGNSPSASFEGSYDVSEDAVTITHVSGETIRDRSTTALVLVVTNETADQTSNVTWAGEDGVVALPVGEGDAFTIDDPHVDADGDGDYFDGDATVGFSIGPGTTVRIVWTGRPLGAPGTRTEILDTYDVPNS